MVKTIAIAGAVVSAGFTIIGFAAHHGAHFVVSSEAKISNWYLDKKLELIDEAATSAGYQRVEIPRRWQDYADDSARANNVARCLVRAVISVESGNGKNRVSKSGALGHMQVMPGTAKAVAGLSTPEEVLHPRKNIDAGTKYLRQQVETFGSVELGLAAYNAGPGAVDRARKKTRGRSFSEIISALPGETQKYVPAVMNKKQECEKWS